MNAIYYELLSLCISALVFLSCGDKPAGTRYISYSAKAPLDPVLQSFLDGYERYFDIAMHTYGSPGAALVIVKDNRIVLKKAFGVKQVYTRDSVDVNTLFRIASLSKGFSAVLSGILVHHGLISWNDKVQKYYPSFTLRKQEQANLVEIRHLLSHTTGLPYQAFSNLIEQEYDLKNIIDKYLPTAKLTAPAGESFAYQNAAFSLIELVLENATGKAFPELLHEYLLKPARMETANCGYLPMFFTKNKALPHTAIDSVWHVDSISKRYYNTIAAGGINASISDMGEWLLLLLGHKPEVASPTMLDSVFTPVIKTGLERILFPGWIGRDSAFYAMGWRVLNQESDIIVYHSGFVNNFHSEIAFNRKDGTGICVLFNGYTPIIGECVVEFFKQWRVAQTPFPDETNIAQ
jgi:beta-lactamase class C